MTGEAISIADAGRGCGASAYLLLLLFIYINTGVSAHEGAIYKLQVAQGMSGFQGFPFERALGFPTSSTQDGVRF